MGTMFRIEHEIEDRKALATRKDHDSPDWSLSSGTHRGIAEADRAKSLPICSGLNGIDARGSRRRSVSGKL